MSPGHPGCKLNNENMSKGHSGEGGVPESVDVHRRSQEGQVEEAVCPSFTSGAGGVQTRTASEGKTANIAVTSGPGWPPTGCLDIDRRFKDL